MTAENLRPGVAPLPRPDTAALDAALRERVAALSLAEKVRLLTGTDFWSIDPEPKAGLRRYVVSDGPVGVRGERWDDRDPSANIPSPTAVAASWDEDLVTRLGALLAAESRRKGVDVLLAPTINLHRTPVGGRHFECFSEDPLLTGRVAAAYVHGLQANGVAACVKHFVGNDQEAERMTADNRIDEQTLRELYLAPFEHVEEFSRPWSYMAAYNQVNGTTMTENDLLDDVLKGDWGSDALVMSDWFATRSTEAAGNAGLDLAMPGPIGPWGAALVEAVEAGRVPEAKVDEKVLRLLRLAARTGAVDGVDAGTQPSAPVFDAGTHEARVESLTREAAAAGFVLVKNSGVLPLAQEVRSVAVVGPNALRGRTLGGGSATVFPASVVHPVEGLLAGLAGVEVRHSLGVSSTDRVPPADIGTLHLPDASGDGIELTFVGPQGQVLTTERRRTGAYTWMGVVGEDTPISSLGHIVARGTLTAAADGAYRIGASGIGSVSVTVDGEQVAATTLVPRPGADIVESFMMPPQAIAEVALGEGGTADIEIRFTPGSLDQPLVAFQVNVAPPRGTDDEEIAAAVALARSSDAAVVVVGTTEEVESEGYDRTSLALPGRQDDLVRAVLAANPNTVVVVNSGAPVLMPWLDDARAVLLAWFPGQQMGAALADVLSGAVEPGGRMPTTWPAPGGVVAPESDPVDGVVEYTEGLDIGYRRYARDGITPAVPFGHGLGYTTWELGAPREVDGGVAVRMTNTGTRDGAHVVQAYLSRPGSAVRRPALWLAGFTKVRVPAGGSAEAVVALPERAFQHWDTAAHAFVTEPGEFTLTVGSSAADPAHTLPLKK
ncbi:MAG: beta-glucosidase [Actinobacteria bacterium]|nr:beta-glucosidase [Actinomycetota bacterium]